MSFKSPFYKLLQYLLGSYFFREQLWRSCRDLLTQNNPVSLQDLGYFPVPEPYHADLPQQDRTAAKKVVFLTGRFRSGSTFLWQIFRHIEGVTAYYEPYNENKWFLQAGRPYNVDPSHLGVDDYHREYLGLAELNDYFRVEWAFQFLYMDQRHIDNDLYKYTSLLINHASEIAVLQCNRIDFRLPWFRANFPGASIIHLYRDPREQWLSVQRYREPVPLDFSYSKDQEHDLFYTYEWARDLRNVFSFFNSLERLHPYAIHYLIWRLSYCFGRTYADLSIAYEDLITDFDQQVNTMMTLIGIENAEITKLAHLKSGELTTRWKQYAPLAWYQEIEQDCERMLEAFFKKVAVAP